MDTKISKEQAEQIADELLSHSIGQREDGLTPALGKLVALRPLRHDFKPNPFVSPAAPGWGVMHRDKDLSK